jgi:hypothetical protein
MSSCRIISEQRVVRMWKEAVLAYLGCFSHIFRGETGETC